MLRTVKTLHIGLHTEIQLLSDTKYIQMELCLAKVIIIGNGISDPSSNPDKDVCIFTSC